MSKKRAKTFSSSPNDFNEEELIAKTVLLTPWKNVILKGILFGIILLLVNFILAIILNLFYFGQYLSNLTVIIFIQGVIFWGLSSLSIFFGPSPTVANIIAMIFNRSAHYQSTSVSLRKGITQFTTGCILIIFILIFP